MLKGLADMNERLEIAESVSALMFAARLGITAWKDLDSETLLNETTNYDEAVQCIMHAFHHGFIMMIKQRFVRRLKSFW